VGTAVFRGPSETSSELLEAQHVQHAHGGEGHSAEVGALCDHGTYQEATVTTTLNGQMRLVGPLLGHKVFRSSNEVVVHILFLFLHAGLVPLFAVFATAAQVRHGEYTALLQQDHPAGAEARRKADVESAVCIEKRRVLPV